jgi:chromosome partitioning protein
VASRHVLIPVLPEYQSVVGGEQTYQTTQLVEKKLNPLLETRQILFTQVDARKRMHKTYREYVREKYGDEVLENVIRTSTSLAKSQDGKTTIFDHDPSSRGALDYANATDELFERIQQETADSAEPEAPSDEPPESSVESTPELSEMLNS